MTITTSKAAIRRLHQHCSGSSIRRILPVFSAAIALSVSSSSGAQSNEARASELLTKPEALRAWLVTHQPQIQGLAATKREAVAATRDARLLPNPILTLAVGGITLGARNPSGLSFTETQNYQATVAYTAEIGKRSHRIQSAQLHAEATERTANFAQASLFADARESLAKLAYLQQRHAVLQDRLIAARGIVELDQTRLDRGDVSGIDHSRLMLDVVNVERELADSSTDIAQAHAECSAALGAPCLADIDAEQLESLLSPLAEAEVSRFNPELRADIAGFLKEAQSEREKARLFGNRAIPDPQLGLGYLHDNLTAAGNQPHTFGVFVSVPLPISDRGQHQRTQAEERANQLAAAARVEQLKARSQAISLLRSESLLSQKLEMLKTRALPLGISVLDATEKAYRLGQVSMTDLLLARRQRAELALDLIDTRYGLFQTRSQVQRVLGLDTFGRSGNAQ